jgi:uncharacterized membrane protein
MTTPAVASTYEPLAPKAAPPATTRISSVDVVRGLVVVLMAIDHVRVFAGVPPGGPSPGVFFTRWVTHIVAPVFVFLAGTSAYLYGRKVGDKRALVRFLAVRGMLLIALELTVIRISWTFNLDFANYLLAGVIWVIGWSMIVLAALVFLPTVLVGAFGVVMMCAHNLADLFVRPHLPALQGSTAWSLGYFAFEIGGTDPLVVLYALVPWVGVMAAGYAFGVVYSMEATRRRRLLLQIGAAAVVLFLVLRALNVYGDPRPWEVPPDATSAWPLIRSFLDTTKYPASLLFLLMTLGPAVLLLAVLENTRGRLTSVLETFGRVPMFYYLLHIPLIHILAIGVSVIRTGGVEPWLFENHPMRVGPPPEGYMWSLSLVYLVTIVAIAILYVACRWYARLKRQSRHPLLKYI